MDVLPAPFGPIMENISPASTLKDTSESAFSPSKLRLIPSTASINAPQQLHDRPVGLFLRKPRPNMSTEPYCANNGGAVYAEVMPPSICRAAPVTNEDFSEQSHTIASAISEGFPR